MAVQFNYRQFASVPRTISGLPGWAATLVVIAAMPGLLLLAVAALLALVGIAVMGLLALPAYRILRMVAGRPIATTVMQPVPPTIEIVPFDADQPPGERRQVDSRVVE